MIKNTYYLFNPIQMTDPQAPECSKRRRIDPEASSDPTIENLKIEIEKERVKYKYIFSLANPTDQYLIDEMKKIGFPCYTPIYPYNNTNLNFIMNKKQIILFLLKENFKKVNINESIEHFKEELKIAQDKTKFIHYLLFAPANDIHTEFKKIGIEWKKIFNYIDGQISFEMTREQVVKYLLKYNYNM